MASRRALAAFLVALLGVVLSPVNASAASVVVVPTQGPQAWPIAENRLVAELRASGIDIVLFPAKPASDRKLPGYVALRNSVAAIQVQRELQRGIVRIWLTSPDGSPGRFVHVRIDLRGANVVSRAVLTSVELVFAQVQKFVQPPVLDGPPAETPPSQVQRTAENRPSNSPAEAPRKSRAETSVIPRFGAGPSFTEGEAAVNFSLGAQLRLTPGWFLSTEATFQPVPHELNTEAGGDATVLLAGARGFLMFEQWSRAEISAGVGVGGGLTLGWSSIDGENDDAAATPVVSIRAQLATLLAANFDAAFVLTASYGVPGITVQKSDLPRDETLLLRPSIDAMLALDWLWQ